MATMFASIEWLRDVLLIPLLMSVGTGVYTGFLVGRIVTFNQSVMSARQRTLTLIDRFSSALDMTKLVDVQQTMLWFYLDIAFALKKEQGQARAAEHLTKASNIVQDATAEIWKVWRRDLAQGMPPDQAVDKALNTVRRLMEDALDEIDMIKPNWGRILVGSWWHEPRNHRGPEI